MPLDMAPRCTLGLKVITVTSSKTNWLVALLALAGVFVLLTKITFESCARSSLILTSFMSCACNARHLAAVTGLCIYLYPWRYLLLVGCLRGAEGTTRSRD